MHSRIAGQASHDVIHPKSGAACAGLCRSLHTETRHCAARRLWVRPVAPADAIAGLTVAIVALPLSIAIAVASGASPAQGLITAIIGGFLVSLLGGSPVPDRRACRGLYRSGEHDGGDAWHGWADPGCLAVRRDAGTRGLVAFGDVREIRALPRDGGIHGGHRHHHRLQPAEGFVRPDAGRAGAWAFPGKAACAGRCRANGGLACLRHRRGHNGGDLHAEGATARAGRASCWPWCWQRL